MTLHDIENAVACLSADDLAKFRNWFRDFDSDAWDRQIEQDIDSGKLDSLADEALRLHKQGDTQEL